MILKILKRLSSKFVLQNSVYIRLSVIKFAAFLSLRN